MRIAKHRKGLIIIVLTLVFFLIPSRILILGAEPVMDVEEEMNRVLVDQMSELNLKEWEELLDEIKKEGDNPLATINIKETILKILKGQHEFDIRKNFRSIVSILFKEFSTNLSLMIKMITISLITGILGNFKVAFNSDSVGELGWLVSYMLIVALILGSITTIVNVGVEAIERMTTFMQIILPILLAMLIGIGGISSSAILRPTTAILAGVTGQFIKNIIIPLILVSITLVIVNNINENIKLGRLGKLAQNTSTWLLGIFFTVFIGILSIQGALSASFDGISIRTTKYAIEAFVPVVGKMFSQTVDMVIGCSLMLRNALGVIGLITVIAICIIPAIKIISLMFVYKLSSAILEPVADKRVVNILKDLGDILAILFVAVMGTAIMFFLTIALLIVIGNITIMMR